MAIRRTLTMGMGIIHMGTTDHIPTIIRAPHTTGTTGIDIIATIVIITTTATRLT
jgi:hypothetical protein